MSEPVLRMEPTRVATDPGGQVTVVVTVYNPGNRVEGYDLDVVAQTPMSWATITPPTLSVYPQQEDSAVVTFAPPSGPGAPGGTLPFGIRVRSQVDPEASAVVEGDLDVGAVAGLQATLTPVTSSGRWSGRHTVKVSNWGNSPARLRITAQDPDQALGFMVSPPTVDVPLGSEAVARLKVRTRHPVLRGSDQRLPFQVVCEPEVPEALGGPRQPMSTPERPVVDAAFNQKPILTRMVVVVAGLLLLALVAGLVWLLTRPDDPEPEEEVAPPDPPTGLRAVGNTSPTEVVLVWDAMEDVEGYKIFTVNPETEARTAPFAVEDPRANSAAITLPPSTRACFLIVSVRDGVDSEFSEGEVCDETEAETVEESAPPGAPSPSVTATPDMGTIGGGGETTGGGGTGGGETPGADEPPLDFVAVLGSFSSDLEADALAQQATFTAAGVPAKVLSTAEYGVAPPGSSPSPSSETRFLVYVDAATPDEATAACESAWSTLEAAGQTAPTDACLVVLQVLTRP